MRAEHTTFSSLPGMRDRTIIIGGFSKDYAMTGWRLGFALGPADILSVMRKVHQYTIMSASTTAQMAAITAMTDPRAEDAVLAMRESYDVRRKLLVGGLASIGLPAFEPRGAFYAFPDIRISGMTSDEFAMTLLEEEAVACVPGPAFGLGGEGYVRMCYATAKEQIEDRAGAHAPVRAAARVTSPPSPLSCLRTGEGEFVGVRFLHLQFLP